MIHGKREINPLFRHDRSSESCEIRVQRARPHVFISGWTGFTRAISERLNELIVHFERRLRALTRRMIKDYPLVHSCEQTDDVYQKAVLRLCRALRAVTPGNTRDLIRLSAMQVRRELLNLARFCPRPDLLQRSHENGAGTGGHR